ncbi:GDP-fucose protein O-fucosyltransferase 1-like isoform X1 [Amphibalanus amphitrite]|uniref:GDP-fucose protein O-fucosyltransferase 1-like isoform X1 n=2 Tax=Amphibalanus amphitrite TaxID=1232801 RepID=UPI001C9242B9|nr:GDP-fucose protein O-fucosyltransferase 1-like isoform X1 [Amphibalanus amphitrite]
MLAEYCLLYNVHSESIMRQTALFLSVLCLLIASSTSEESAANEVDERGYILFCPCMGRFGNQMDYFLGTLSFAKELNRTLVLAPWVEYHMRQPKSIQVPFDEYFRVDEVAKYHPAITMETFMSEIAPKIWPPSKRISFCYQQRQAYGEPPTDPCAAKNGNPPGPFWDTYGIDFVSSELHSPLSYDLWNVAGEAERWRRRYPPHRWPVLAFAGSPASYPVLEVNAGLQRHFQWSESVRERARELRRRLLPAAPFVGVHLRLGSDWERACAHTRQATGNMFSSAQCLGYRQQHGRLTERLCYPDWPTVARQMRRAARHTRAPAVYVATDAPERLDSLRRELRGHEQEFELVTWQPAEPGRPADAHAELALLARANLFIGNCVSSFSAVVFRERDALGLPSAFWAFPEDSESESESDRDADPARPGRDEL